MSFGEFVLIIEAPGRGKPALLLRLFAVNDPDLARRGGKGGEGMVSVILFSLLLPEGDSFSLGLSKLLLLFEKMVDVTVVGVATVADEGEQESDTVNGFWSGV